MTTTERINTLALESTKTFLDAAYLAQKQSGQFAEAWFKSLEANQQATRNVVSTLVHQAQEAQRLWVSFTQDLLHTNLDNIARASDAQVRGMSTQIDVIKRQTETVANGVKSAAETVISTS